jgi:hypothetical protein
MYKSLSYFFFILEKEKQIHLLKKNNFFFWKEKTFFYNVQITLYYIYKNIKKTLLISFCFHCRLKNIMNIPKMNIISSKYILIYLVYKNIVLENEPQQASKVHQTFKQTIKMTRLRIQHAKSLENSKLTTLY